ncbi:MAG: MFS transporter [Gammaproteobacteria bacterium]|nr:MFS transporter [Gammaproteobacteria bacterium]
MQIENQYFSETDASDTKAKGQSSFYPWIIWGLGAAFFLAEYFARIAPGIMVPELMSAFRVNALTLGSLSAIFYTAYLTMQMPVGTLVDKFGPHRLLTITAAICALGCFLFASADYLGLAQVARFMMGFGAAFAFVGTLKLATIWFPPSRFGLLSGLTQALGMVGGAVAAGPLAVLVHQIGWRHTMWLIGIILLLLAILIGLVVRDQPKKSSVTFSSRTDKKLKFWDAFSAVLRNPQSWLNATYAGLVYAPTAAFAELWGVTYLARVYDIDRTVAANAVSCIFIGLAIGCPVGGWISDKIRRRRPVMLVAAVVSLIFMSCALYIPNLSVTALFILLFFYGIANSGFATSYALAGEINPPRVAGTSLGFANMASVLVGACFQPIIGWFLDLQWDGQMLNEAPLYSVEAFRHAMMALPVCLFLGVIVTFFVKETYCRSAENK